MSFADHYSTIAGRYATYRPHYPPALIELLAAHAAHEVAWDVGCGNGQLSVALADAFDRVIATDPAQAQLDAAIAHPRVDYRCAPAEASGLADASVDLVVAAQAAHWFAWGRFVDEAARIARPGALIALVSYGILRFDGDAEVVRFYRDVAGPYWPPERVHVENGYRDLVLPWPAVPAPSIAMTASWTRDELLGYVGTWSATVRLVQREGIGPVARLAEQLTAAWPGDERRTIRWPLTIKLARR